MNFHIQMSTVPFLKYSLKINSCPKSAAIYQIIFELEHYLLSHVTSHNLRASFEDHLMFHNQNDSYSVSIHQMLVSLEAERQRGLELAQMLGSCTGASHLHCPLL